MRNTLCLVLMSAGVGLVAQAPATASPMIRLLEMGLQESKTGTLVILDNPKSALSESIRSIRTNLQFISSDKKSKVVSITSTVSGEGKSFISINLAGIISLLNRKVILLDLDLRKPKLHLSFGRDNKG